MTAATSPGLEDFITQFLYELEQADLFAPLPLIELPNPPSVHAWADPAPASIDWHAAPEPEDDPFGHAPAVPPPEHSWVDPNPGPVDWHAEPEPDDDPFGHGEAGTGEEEEASAGTHQWNPEDAGPPDYHGAPVDAGNPWHQASAPAFDLLA